VDAKGRVSVPALFRRVLEQGEAPGLVLIPRLRGQGCIEGFTLDYIDRIARAIGRMKPFSKARRRLEYEFMAGAIPMQLDENGRIVLSPKLQAEIGLDGQALFVGMGESFQIWAPEAYEAHLATLDDGEDGDPFDQLPWDDDGAGA
jgi:MraZ protein